MLVLFVVYKYTVLIFMYVKVRYHRHTIQLSELSMKNNVSLFLSVVTDRERAVVIKPPKNRLPIEF